MLSLTRIADAGIRWCCNGSQEERDNALKAFNESKSLVLDHSAFFAIWHFDLYDIVSKWGARKLLLSQSTFDRIRDIKESAHESRAGGYMAANDSRQYFHVEASEDERKVYVESLDKLLSLIRTRFTIVPVLEVASLDPEKREALIDVFGRDAAESIYLGAREGHVLWTDDLTVAEMQNHECQKRSRIWTQAVLHAGLQDKVLDEKRFNDISARLVGCEYTSTLLNADTVVSAGQQAAWDHQKFPLRQTMRQFGNKSIPPQARIFLAGRTVAEMFRQVASPFARSAFLLAVLRQLGSRSLAVGLGLQLENAFRLDFVAAHEATSTIAAWLRGPFIAP
jgi:hypothetical protein